MPLAYLLMLYKLMTPMYGNSIARGSKPLSPSDAPLAYANFSPGGEWRWYDAALDDPANYASLAWLNEPDNSPAGETLASDSAMMIKQLLLEEGGA